MNEHTHHPINKPINLNKAFIIGIVLNLIFVIIEFVAGFRESSLGLISDAGHNLSDVASLLLAMLAFHLSKVSATKKYTYGYKKSTVLVSLINAVILLIAVGFIIAESIEKLGNPQSVQGGVIVWVAGIGIIINMLTVVLFIKGKEKDLNIKGAYLHMLADTLVSFGVVLSGILILFTGWYIIDPIIGLVVAGVIVVSTWNLLKDSLRLSLDGVPRIIDIEKITQIICSQEYVVEVHHLHIWALSTTENALTAHIVLDDMNTLEDVKQKIKLHLSEEGIDHATLEFESIESLCNHACVPHTK